MTSMTGPACREIRQLLGVYVVGAIDPAERAYVDSHLADCAACREELAGLAGLPALLGRVPLADAERLSEGDYGLPDMEEPPAELLNSLLRRVAGRRRSRRWRSVLALAAAVAIAAGSTAAVFGANRPQAPAARDVAQASNARLTAQVDYSPAPGRPAMQIAETGIPAGTICQLFVVDASGQRHLAGTWTVGSGYGQKWYSASWPAGAGQARAFQITAQGKTLLRIPAS